MGFSGTGSTSGQSQSGSNEPKLNPSEKAREEDYTVKDKGSNPSNEKGDTAPEAMVEGSVSVDNRLQKKTKNTLMRKDSIKIYVRIPKDVKDKQEYKKSIAKREANRLQRPVEVSEDVNQPEAGGESANLAGLNAQQFSDFLSNNLTGWVANELNSQVADNRSIQDLNALTNPNINSVTSPILNNPTFYNGGTNEPIEDPTEPPDRTARPGDFPSPSTTPKLAQGYTPGRGYKDGAYQNVSDVMDPGLRENVYQRALLNALASPESSGQYDEVFRGKGLAGQVKDFNGHPGINPVTGKSDTGKYQFLRTTWRDTVNSFNKQNPNDPITDFSPRNQDRAAWFLADRAYRTNTGRDLLGDLQSGNLNPNALGGTWVSIKGNWYNNIYLKSLNHAQNYAPGSTGEAFTGPGNNGLILSFPPRLETSINTQ